MTTKITGLTHHNVRALRELFPGSIAAGHLKVTRTTAEWKTLMPSAAAIVIEEAIRINGGRAHPGASLHAVARKLRKLAESEPPLDPELDEVRPDGPETDRGGLIGQQPY